MSESIATHIACPDGRESFTKNLETCLSLASQEIAQLAFEIDEHFCSLGAPEDFQKQIHELLMATVYVPIMMGDDNAG
jgi:hypothetical protein